MACSIERSAEKTARLLSFLQQHSLNYDRLAKLAEQHRLTPLLYRTLREMAPVPDAFLATLRQECLAIATDNLVKLREYHRMAALLTEHGIGHRAFKGIYLAEHGYPDSSLRPIGDMDVLVAEKDVCQAVRFLAPDGYQVGDQYQSYLRQAERVMLDDLHEISLFKPFYAASRFDIDLHWRVDCLLREIGSFGLRDALSSSDFEVENQVILLVLHHGVNNGWKRIGYVNDLYFLLRKAHLNWPWLLEKMEFYHLEGVFWVGLHWCRQLWDLPLPPSVEERMPARLLRRLAEAVEKSWEQPTVPSFRRLLAHFVAAQSPFVNKLKVCGSYGRSFIFRSSFITLRHYQLYIPKEWGFTTVFIRAFLALRRQP